MRTLIIIIIIFILQGCSVMPVFEGDYNRNLKEISGKIQDSKGKIGENAEIINTLLNVEPETAKVLAREHAKDIGEWAKEPVEFSEPTMGGNLLKYGGMALSLLMLAGGGGMASKISSLKGTVKAVAGMDGKAGIEEAKKRGVVV